MAASAAIIGKGTTLGYGATSGGSFTSYVEVVDCGNPEVLVGNVEATHYESDNATIEKKSAVWQDPQDLALVLNYKKAQETTIRGQVGDEQFFKITLPDGSTYVFPGFIARLGGGSIPNKDIIRTNATITITGPIVFTAAS